MAFAHLHVHTEYSALDGMIRIKDLFEVAAEHGQTAAAVTDHGTLAGMWAAQQHADKAGVKLIAGQEFYLANGSRTTKTPFWVPRDDNSADEDSERSEETEQKLVENAEKNLKARAYQHLTVLAYNETGWRNLVLLNNKAQETIWFKPRIDYKLIAEHSEGLIVLTGCLGGPVIGPMSHAQRADDEAADFERRAVEASGADDARVLRDRATSRRAFAVESRQAARDNIQSLIDAVGAENVYVEIMDHGIDEESVVIPQVVDLAREFGLGIVATNDAHHTHEHGTESHAAWLLVQSKSTLADPKYQFHGHGYWLKTEDEMRAVRPEPWWQEACDTTQLIADRVEQRVIPGHRDLLPKFPTPDGFASNRDYMYHLLRDGARRIYGGISKRVHDRIRTEMEVIEESGYVDYFLVVHDVIWWCLNNGILVGPGRGSAGGSLVAYLMGITRVDPLRYGLLFERFLERGRQEPPDIDIDFPQSRRDDVIQYLRDRWGHDKVAFIGTFMMARTKAAIKDAARVIGQTPLGNRMTNVVPTVEAKPMPMADLLDSRNPATVEYRKLVDKTDDSGEAPGRRIHDMASSFENIIKGFGIHASGIIVSAAPLFDLVPMRMTKRGWALQWTGPEAEQVGLLKVDVLGLRNLDIVAKTVEYIEQTTGEKIDPLALPDPDAPDQDEAPRVAKAWRTIGDGRTEGLFQLESPKMTELAQDVAPHSLNDLSALVALFRPGPMGEGMHTEYASRKRNPSLVSYRDFTTDAAEQQALETVLADTHGLMVYQEQAMMLGTVIAGFDAPGRSKLRKAISKKKADVMAEVGGKFLAGAPHEHRDENGNVVSIPFTEVTANTVWSAMVSFASYAFNRSHSATYGYLAYITAYLKGNWPVEFAAATLAVTSGKEKRLQVLRSLKREGIEVLAPDVNAGNGYTAPAGDGTIRIGLAEVKGLKDAGVRIAETRSSRDVPFEAIGELYSSVQKPTNEDGTGGGSAVTSAHITALIEAGAMDAWGPRLGLYSIAGAAKNIDVPPPAMEWGILERASRQRSVLGLLVGTHPLTALQDQVRAYDPFPNQNGWDTRASVSVVPITKVPDIDGATITTIGLLAEWSESAYSRGRCANILIEGSTASIGGTMWDRELTEHTDAQVIPAVGKIVALTGRVRFRTIEADPDDEGSMPQTVKELMVTRVREVPVIDPALDEWPREGALRVPHLTGGLSTFEREGLEAAQDGMLDFPTDDPEPDPDPQGPAPEPERAAAPAPVEQVTEPDIAQAPAPDAVDHVSPMSNVAVMDDYRARQDPKPEAPTAASRPATHGAQLRVSTRAPGWLVEGVDNVPDDAPFVTGGQRPGDVVHKVNRMHEIATDDAFTCLGEMIHSWYPVGIDNASYVVRLTHEDGFVAYVTVGKSVRTLVAAPA